MTYIAAIDAGASEIKACLFDTDGNEIASASRDCPSDSPAAGWAQCSAEVLTQWPLEILKETIDSSGVSVGEIKVVAVTGSRATVVPFGVDGQAVGPVILWYDRRATDAAERIKEEIGQDDFFNLTGVALDPTPSITKIMWWRENHPEIFAAASVYALPQTAVAHALTGDGWYCDDSNGSYLGFMGLHSRSWEDVLLEVAGVTPDKLPQLVPPGTIAGPLSDAATTVTGLAADTPVVISGSDNACFKLGAGVEGKGVACMYIGTAGVVGVISEKPIVDRRLNCCPAALPDYWDVDGLLLTAGAAYRWLRDLLNGAGQGEELSFKTMDAMAAGIPPGSEGVVVVPHLAGAGSPLWDPDACGQIIGLRLSHGAAHLVRAAMEGVVFAQRHALDALMEHVPDISSLQLTGGGASELWSQILADATGLPVAIPSSQQSTCLGAAMMGGVAAGIYSDHADAIRSMTTTERQIEPDTSKKAIYDAAYQLYLQAVETDHG